MLRSLFTLIAGTLILASCQNSTSRSKEYLNVQSSQIQTANTDNLDAGFELIKAKCYACHNPAAPSHDEILAPPLAGIKGRYLMTYSDKESFTRAVSDFVSNPTEEKALMRGAVMKFKVMPNPNLMSEEIEIIASYIFENELEEPEWFAAHEKEMHGGKGKGKMMNR